MRVTEGYPLAPGCCFYCKVPREGPVVDTLRDVEAGAQDHRVYWCAVCVGDAWSSLIAYQEKRGDGPGLVPAARLDEVLRENFRLGEELVDLRHAVHVALPDLLGVLTKLVPEEVPT